MKCRKKGIVTLIIGLLTAAVLFACGRTDGRNAGADGPGQEKQASGEIIILYTNDVHSYINNKTKDENGNETDALNYASVAALKKELKKEGKNVILVDAGDYSQGNAFGAMDEGATIAKLMNAAGYDVATIGNHEFDYGQLRAFGIMSELDFPVISCNFCNVSDGSPVLEPYTIIEAGNKKVAFIGISTPETFSSAALVYFQNEKGELIYEFKGGRDGEEFYRCVQKYIDEVKEKADYIIGVGHLGNDPSSEPYTSRQLIKNTEGLDALIDGHSHETVEGETVKDKSGRDVVLTQTGSYFTAIGKMTINGGSVRTELIKEYPYYDEEVRTISEKWVSSVNEKLGEKIAVLDVPMYITEPGDTGTRIVRRTETNLGDFCADACYYYLNEIAGLECDFVLQNGGGVRESVAPGDYTYLTSKTVNPFGNVICVVEIKGSQLKDVLEKGAMYTGLIDQKTGKMAETGGFMHVAGLQYTVDTSVETSVTLDESGTWVSGPSGEYRVRDIKVYNRQKGVYEPLEPDKTYRTGGINYLLRNQGEGLSMISDLSVIQDYITEDYLVLSEYAKSFAKDSDGFAHIRTENSPLASYEGYLIDYENPYGAGRIILK